MKHGYERPEAIIPPARDYALEINHKFFRGWEQWYLLTSDAHWDAPECMIKLLHRDLALAKERKALIIDNGDWWEVIGSSGDRRGTKGNVLEEHSVSDYLDRLVDDGANEFEEYADCFVEMGDGNHDLKILQVKETNIKRRWIEEMNRRRSPGLAPIHSSGYTSWIRFKFQHPSRNIKTSLAMKREHGEGGNAPVTKGVINANRRQVRTHGATFFVSGHIHEGWQMPWVIETLNPNTSRVEQRLCQHIQLSAYRLDFSTEGSGTWIMQRAGHARPVGGSWIRFFCADDTTISWEVIPTVGASDYPKLADYLRSKPRISRAG